MENSQVAAPGGDPNTTRRFLQTINQQQCSFADGDFGGGADEFVAKAGGGVVVESDVGDDVFEAAFCDAARLVRQRKGGEIAGFFRAEALASICDGGDDLVAGVEVPAAALPRQEAEDLEVCDRMIDTSACPADQVKFLEAAFQSYAHTRE